MLKERDGGASPRRIAPPSRTLATSWSNRLSSTDTPPRATIRHWRSCVKGRPGLSLGGWFVLSLGYPCGDDQRGKRDQRRGAAGDSGPAWHRLCTNSFSPTGPRG